MTLQLWKDIRRALLAAVLIYPVMLGLFYLQRPHGAYNWLIVLLADFSICALCIGMMVRENRAKTKNAETQKPNNLKNPKEEEGHSSEQI